MTSRTATRHKASTLQRNVRGFMVWSASPLGLAVIFTAGLLLRLLVAPMLVHPGDRQYFAWWATRLAAKGSAGFYADPQMDYPPAYPLLLWGLGKIAKFIGSGFPWTFVLKLPAIAADLVLAALCAHLADGVRARRSAAEVSWRGVAAMAILFNPAVFFISSVWGQVDAIAGVLVVGALMLLSGHPRPTREAAGVVVLALSVLTKPQTGFLVPIAVALVAWRGVAAVRSKGVLAGGGLLTLRLGALGGLAALVALVVAAPFGLSLLELVHLYLRSGARYPFASEFAFNAWALAGPRPDVASGIQRAAQIGRDTHVVRVLGVPALYVGMAAFVVTAVIVVRRMWRCLEFRKDQVAVGLFGVTAMTCAAFAVLTRMHERYLFLAIICLTPLIVYPAFRWALAGLSVLFTINAYFAYLTAIEVFTRRPPNLAGLPPLGQMHSLRVPFLYALFYGGEGMTQFWGIVTALMCLMVALMGWSVLTAKQPAQNRQPPRGGRRDQKWSGQRFW